jgi:serine/threonine protein kinase
MAANPTRCPSSGELERLLAEELRGPERGAVETHVEECSTCQEQLARLSTTTVRQVARASNGPNESDPEPDEAFLHRLREMSPPPTLFAWGDSSADGASEANEPPAAARPAPDAARFPGGRLGRYEILEKLATGGMGAVYKARHVELGKVVALKVLPATEMDEVSLARFKNEMRAIGRLDHPHIVAAHDAGDADGVHYLAMELVDGVDLARLVQQHGRLSVADACEAVRQAALGLQHAFERGLVHRDIKPSNLMLARGGLVRLLDLGLARASGDAPSETLTSKGTLLGTADYLAPEQWEHPHAADIRADIYGLGCTLYHLLAGEPPFSSPRYGTVLKKMRGHLEDEPERITRHRPEVPSGLASVLDRMLAKGPTDRFSSPAEVTTALEPFTAGANLVRLSGQAVSDLGRHAVSPGLNSADTARRVEALTETRQSGGRRKPSAAARRYVLPAALASLLALFLVGAFVWPGFWPSHRPDAKSLTVTDMRVIHYRDDGGRKLLGDLRTNTAPIRLNDSVEVAAELSVPTYYYLIAFNPKGGDSDVIQLCYPEGEDGKEAKDTPPDKNGEVRYPRKHKFVLDAVGLQVFVLAGSAKPLPAYAEWRSGVGAIPWEGVASGGDSCWHFDGREFTAFGPRDRGILKPNEEAPKPLRDLVEFFRSRAEFEVVQVIAFPVVK